MKLFVLPFVLLSSLAFASGAEKCTEGHLRVLEKAEGQYQESVRKILHYASTEFECKVKTTHNFFPQDCNRFVFTKYEFDIKSDDVRLKAVVHDGRISCTRMTRTDLVSASVK